MSISIQRAEDSALKKSKPVLVVIVLMAICQAFFFRISDVAQDSVRHLVTLKRSWAVNGDYIRRDPDKVLVFFMGGSRITGGVIPEVFDDEAGFTRSYNVSLPGMPLAAYYFWLRDFFAHHDSFQYPDYILVDPSETDWSKPHFFEYALANAGAPEVLNYSLATGSSSMLINYFLPLRFHWPEVRRYLKSRFYSSSPGFFQDRLVSMYESKYEEYETYKHDWFYLFHSQFVAPERHWLARKSLVEATRGYYDFRELSVREGSLPGDYRFRKEKTGGEPLAATPYLRKFLELTGKHGIKVVMIEDYAAVSQVSKLKVLKTTSAEGTDGTGNVIVAPYTLKKQLYENHYFSDPLHLTIPGAADFTKRLARVFQNAVHDNLNPQP